MSTASCRVGESFRRLQWMLGFLLTIQVYSREIYVGLENPFGGGGELTLDIRVVCLVGQKMEKLCRRR